MVRIIIGEGKSIALAKVVFGSVCVGVDVGLGRVDVRLVALRVWLGFNVGAATSLYAFVLGREGC